MTSHVTRAQAERGRKLLDQVNDPDWVPPQAILADLARVKVLFQLRTIATVMGLDPNTVRQGEPPRD